MPFTFDGDWVPSSPSKKSPIRITQEKSKRGVITKIYHLPLSEKELKQLSSSLKKHLGCGGAIKEGVLEIQGAKVEEVKAFLTKEGLLLV